ncbi:MAG: O-antigen ligase family protein, partial [Desulfobacteraceae bacterium]|nr:O-antigen ligase family protein [Desulfobacteraceae bacterium]
YILFQLIPLPPFIVEWLSPNAFQIHHTTSELTNTSSWMTITVNQKATLSEFFRYATYTLFYILTVQLLSKKGILQATVITITVFGGLLAFSSILQFYLTEDMVLWFRHSPRNSMVVGPYVNHNHYAGLMEMIFPIVLGLFLFYRPRIKNTSLIKGIAEILSQEKANIHILIGTSALLIIISIFVSLSRGAMISTFLSLILFTFLLLKRKISKGNTTLIIGVIMLTVLSIGWFGWDQIFERFAKLKNAQGIIYEYRLDFWKDTKEIIRQYPITGSGTGTFSHIYPLHRSLKSGHFLTHAHNDYLELLAEGGMIAFTLAASFLLSLFYKTYKVFTRRRDAFSIYLYMGCITAMVSLLIHSFTDFNLHIGANGLWFFFVAGIAVSAANTGIRKQSMETRLLPVSSLTKKSCAMIIASLISIFIIGYTLSNLIGNFYYSNIKNFEMSTKTPPNILKKIEKVADLSSRFDPFHADYPFMIANTSWFLKNNEKSKSKFIESLYLNPLNSMHLSRFATYLAQHGDANRAKIAFEKSVIYEKTNAEYTFQYAAWLFKKNQLDLGIKYMTKTLILNEKYFDQVLTAMIVSGISDEDMQLAIPELPGPSIEYAKYLSSTGFMEDAMIKYLDALDLIEDLENQSNFIEEGQSKQIRSYYAKIYIFFMEHNDLKNAMHVAEKAEAALPLDAGFKVALGDLYFRQGIIYKAQEKYGHALLLDPGNKWALEMMKKINP